MLLFLIFATKKKDFLSLHVWSCLQQHIIVCHEKTCQYTSTSHLILNVCIGSVKKFMFDKAVYFDFLRKAIKCERVMIIVMRLIHIHFEGLDCGSYCGNYVTEIIRCSRDCIKA